MSSTYSDVDASGDPVKAVRDQERLDGLPQVQAYKERTYSLLSGADRILDVGCGPGADVVRLGIEHCLGVDASLIMCSTAAERGAATCCADAHALPFPDGRFGGARADRVLQHLHDPVRAVAEIVRVTRPGARIVLAEPDQETLVICVPGVRQELTDRMKALRRDVGYRNGRLASLLPGMLAFMRVEEISLEAFPLVLTDPDQAFGLPGWPRLWRARGHDLSDADVAEWDEGMQRARQGAFVYTLTYFVVSAVVT